MDSNALPRPTAHAQSTIKSFFQPRAPSYTAPPASTTTASRPNGPPNPTITAPLSPQVASKSTPISPNVPSSTHDLPAQGSISKIQEKHIQPLRRINALLLPINYPDSFYHRITDPNTSPNFSRVIQWQDISSKADFGSASDPKVIGGIVCRLDRDEDSKTSSIYIQSLAVLSPYRSHGLATAALDAIIQSVVSTRTDFPITSLYAHVWTGNEDGLQWYKARSFTQEKTVVQGYYSRLKPSSAWILRRSIAPSDHLRHTSQQDSSTNASPPAGSSSTPASNPTVVHPTPTPVATSSGPSRPNLRPHASSFQNAGPGHEWNDLPADIISPSPSPSVTSFQSGTGLLMPPDGGSATSSRSSSRSRPEVKGGKKKRVYPTAAYGS